MYASVQTTSVVSDGCGGMEIQVQANVYRGTPQSQHNPVWNVVESFERAVGLHEEGHSDCANRGTITKQDVAVATGVVGVVTGGMALATGATTIVGAAVTAAGMLNSADDIGTNANGESFLQQQVATDEAKNKILVGKNVISVANVLSSAKNLVSLPNANMLEESVNIINTSVGIINSSKDFNND